MQNIWIFTIVVFASLIKGITGFGFALVSLPLLMLWYTPKELIPVMMMCNLIASLLIVFQKKETKLVNKSFRSLIVWGGLFTILGVIALKFIPDQLMIHIMGVFFILLSILSLVNKNIELKMPDYAHNLAGAIIGFLTGTISVSGPPLALFLNAAKVNNQEFREIFSWFSVITSLVAILGYFHLGLINRQSLQLTLFFTPILLLGTIIGKRLNSRLSAVVFKQLSIALSLVASILLISH